MVDDAAGLRLDSQFGLSNSTRTRSAPAILNTPDGATISIRFRRRLERRAPGSEVRVSRVGLRGWPKTSGSRGMHVNVRIEPSWTFAEVRRAAWPCRAVERRLSGQLKMVEGRAAQCVSRLQPECEGPDHVLCVFGPPASAPSLSATSLASASL